MARDINILITVPQSDAGRYFKNLNQQEDFRLRLVNNIEDAIADLADKDTPTDVFVISQVIIDVDTLISDLRKRYPRLLIIIVDEEADFAIPGHADDISTEPFENDDLARRIQRLMSDRQLETLRADSLPAVRSFAKTLRDATGAIGKLQAAAAACLEMNYDYVAIYRQETENPIQMRLKAQDGSRAIRSVAPETSDENDLMGWVSKSGESQIAGPSDTPTHPLVKRGRLGAAVCVPINISNIRYGVLVACRDVPGSITKENILMLELISAQLAAALSKEGAV